MSIFQDMLSDRPFVLYVVSFVLAFCSLVFSTAWLIIPMLGTAMLANYLSKKEDHEKNPPK